MDSRKGDGKSRRVVHLLQLRIPGLRTGYVRSVAPSFQKLLVDTTDDMCTSNMLKLSQCVAAYVYIIGKNAVSSAKEV